MLKWHLQTLLTETLQGIWSLNGLFVKNKQLFQLMINFLLFEVLYCVKKMRWTAVNSFKEDYFCGGFLHLLEIGFFWTVGRGSKDKK